VTCYKERVEQLKGAGAGSRRQKPTSLRLSHSRRRAHRLRQPPQCHRRSSRQAGVRSPHSQRTSNFPTRPISMLPQQPQTARHCYAPTRRSTGSAPS